MYKNDKLTENGPVTTVKVPNKTGSLRQKLGLYYHVTFNHNIIKAYDAREPFY